jgi:Kinesin motor domain
LLRRETNKINETLYLVEDSKTKEFFIRGVTEESVDTLQDILELLNRGELNRHYAETKLNHQSSRSHTIFRVFVQAIIKDSSVSQHVMHSILNFVDLAGSEKLSSHFTPKEDFNPNDQYHSNEGPQRIDPKMVRERINEGKNINKSLFFLT